jgi:spore coat protein CotF
MSLREQLKDDISKIKKIIKEIERTDKTDGCYNPYHTSFQYLVELVHEVREKLVKGVEK